MKWYKNPWVMLGGAVAAYFVFFRPKTAAAAAAKIEADVAASGAQMPRMSAVDKVDMSALTPQQLAAAKEYMHDYYRRVGSWPSWQTAFASQLIKQVDAVTGETTLTPQTWSQPHGRVPHEDPGWTPQGRM